MKKKPLLLLFILTLFFFSTSLLSIKKNQTDTDQIRNKIPKIFLDCGYCDIDYIRTEIPFVNYVHDRKNSDIHILITYQRTGSSGRAYTIEFFGKKSFKNLNDTIKYISKQTDTEDEIRRGLVKSIKIGLMRYIAKTPLSQYISILFNKTTSPTAVIDKWDNWVFRVGLNGSIFAEKSYNSNYINGSLRADRITPDLKINLGLYANIYESNFEVDEETVKNSQKSQNFYGLIVKSLGDHWSTGISSSVNSSTFNNTKISFRLAPAIEYNIFPYAQSTKKQFLFHYSIGYKFIKYREETIYEKLEENLFSHKFEVSFELKTTWGSISTSFEGSQYLHDLSKNRLQFYNRISLNILKGFSFNLRTRYSMIHDQLSLFKGDATKEEILLSQRELATTYDYYISIGISYSFGSIYNNVVNPRFGN